MSRVDDLERRYREGPLGMLDHELTELRVFWGDEIIRLREIVAKLPKCWRLVDGKRVQDCPVTLGMEIWHRRIAQGWVPDKVLGIFWAHGVVWLDVGCGPKIEPICCCNTREAAEALAAKGKAAHE